MAVGVSSGSGAGSGAGGVWRFIQSLWLQFMFGFLKIYNSRNLRKRKGKISNTINCSAALDKSPPVFGFYELLQLYKHAANPPYFLKN